MRKDYSKDVWKDNVAFYLDCVSCWYKLVINYTCPISRNTEFGDESMAFYSCAYILVTMLRHTSDKVTVKTDCIVSGYHDGVNFSVTLIN